MTTTTVQNIAHRNDLTWTKSKGKSFTANEDLFISEYTNLATGQTIRKSWKMTGQDWFIFNSADQIIGRAHSLTWAKLAA
jgi:hypothetical protein